MLAEEFAMNTETVQKIRAVLKDNVQMHDLWRTAEPDNQPTLFAIDDICHVRKDEGGRITGLARVMASVACMAPFGNKPVDLSVSSYSNFALNADLDKVEHFAGNPGFDAAKRAQDNLLYGDRTIEIR